MRQYELDSLIRDARARRIRKGEPDELPDRLVRAERLVAEPVSRVDDIRASAVQT
jgi:hypothetical protein